MKTVTIFTRNSEDDEWQRQGKATTLSGLARIMHRIYIARHLKGVTDAGQEFTDNDDIWNYMDIAE